MLSRYLIAILLLASLSQLTHAQLGDSLSSGKLIYKSLLPSALIVSGLLMNNSQFEQDIHENLRARLGYDFHSQVDDFFQYIPIAELYLADALGVQGKNHWFDQTKYLLISNLITSGITHGLKSITQKDRPDGSSRAFPSGHTSFAFTNATVLKNEFQGTAPLLAYSGYAFASTTGFYRMMNNKHWLSDVVMGAGIGIMVTELVYYFEPFKAFNPFKKSGCVTLIPSISERHYGFYFSCQL